MQQSTISNIFWVRKKGGTKPLSARFERDKLLSMTSTQTLLPIVVVNWEKNRQPDPLRVAELAEYLKKTAYVPGVLYAFIR